MAIAKSALPKMNRSNRRTKLRPRELVGVAYQFTGSPYRYSGTVRANNTTFSTTGIGRAKTQRYLDTAMTKVAP